MFCKAYSRLGLLIALFLWTYSRSSDAQTKTTVVEKQQSTLAVDGAADLGANFTKPTEQGWGTLQGCFVFQGDIPPIRYLATADDHKHIDESLVIDPDTRGIRNIVMYARKVSRVHHSYEEAGNHPVVCEQKHCIFLPHVLAIRVSQTLTIYNHDSEIHTCTIRPDLDFAMNVLLQPGVGTEYQFLRQQWVPVSMKCEMCPMKAYVLPRKNPYFAITDETGCFQIAKLPAGQEIEFQVWHESSGEPHGALVARPDAHSTQPRCGARAFERTTQPANAGP